MPGAWSIYGRRGSPVCCDGASRPYRRRRCVWCGASKAGIDFIWKAKAAGCIAPIVAVTESNDPHTANEVSRSGALRIVSNDATSLEALRTLCEKLQRTGRSRAFELLIGVVPEIRELRKLIRLIAPSSATVL